MPISQAEVFPSVQPPLQSVEAAHEAKLSEIKTAAATITGEAPVHPVDPAAKIVIEISPDQTTANITPVSQVPKPGFFTKLGNGWERFMNWKNTFLHHRAGATKSQEGLDATIDRAVGQAEKQGQITNLTS